VIEVLLKNKAFIAKRPCPREQFSWKKCGGVCRAWELAKEAVGWPDSLDMD